METGESGTNPWMKLNVLESCEISYCLIVQTLLLMLTNDCQECVFDCWNIVRCNASTSLGCCPPPPPSSCSPSSFLRLSSLQPSGVFLTMPHWISRLFLADFPNQFYLLQLPARPQAGRTERRSDPDEMLASRQRHTGSLSRHVQVIITFVLRKLLLNIAHIVNSGWTHWRLHPQNQTKMRMGDLFLIHPDSNSLLRRSWTNECHSIKNLQISFRSRWTGPTWWTVETRWSFSLGKLCPVSSVRRWTQDVSFKVVFVSTRFLPQMFGVSQPSYIDENLTDLPELDNEDSERLRSFVVSF